MALLSTLDLARRVDRAEIDFCALAGETGAPGGVASLAAGGGLALFTTPGSPFNKVLGVGLEGPVADEDLDRLERFYRERRSPAQIELCPLAHVSVPDRLCRRGYVVQGFENLLARLLPDEGPDPPDGARGVRVSVATPAQDELWIRTVAEGFGAAEAHVGGGVEHETFTTEQVAAMMAQFCRPAVRRYLAWADGRPAGGGASWLRGGVQGIAATATLPAFRRRGVQMAIARAAVHDARGSADLVVATTAPGSTSQRTFERLGFRVLYTRAIFVKA